MTVFTLYQLIILCICLYFIVTRIKKRINNEPRQSLVKLLATILLWGGIAFIALFPNLINAIIILLGINSNNYSFSLILFIILLILLYKLLTIIERIEKNITEIVRKEALRDLEKTTK